MEVYHGKERNCSSCGKMLAKKDIIISGKKKNDGGREVLFCSLSCQSNYSIENKVEIKSGQAVVGVRTF